MKNLILTAIILLSTGLSLRAENDTQADTLFQKLLAAQVARNYEAFVADGTTLLKAALTKTQFDASCDLMIPKLAVGYDIIPMGELNQRGCQVYLYCLRFKNGSDDMLGTLALKSGHVAGIYFK